MVLDQIVPIQIATLLHSAGYRGPVIQYYNILNKHLFNSLVYIHTEAIFAPTYQEALTWLKSKGVSVECNDAEMIEALNKLTAQYNAI